MGAQPLLFLGGRMERYYTQRRLFLFATDLTTTPRATTHEKTELQQTAAP
jgi:hypothetical protein